MVILKTLQTGKRIDSFHDKREHKLEDKSFILCNRFHSRTVSLKGRVACEMNTCDELIATELLFFNVLEPLNPPEVASLLSALVFQV